MAGAIAKRNSLGHISGEADIAKIELPCEHATKAIIPSIRAVIARVLVEDMKVSRYMAAKLLDVTPAAITNYLNKRRGDKYIKRIESDEKLYSQIRDIARKLVEAKGLRTLDVYLEYKNTVCRICHTLNVYVKLFNCPLDQPGDK